MGVSPQNPLEQPILTFLSESEVRARERAGAKLGVLLPRVFDRRELGSLILSLSGLYLKGVNIEGLQFGLIFPNKGLTHKTG